MDVDTNLLGALTARNKERRTRVGTRKEDEPGPALEHLGEKCPHNVPIKEISDSLGISLASVKARLHRARNLLLRASTKKELKRPGYISSTLLH